MTTQTNNPLKSTSIENFRSSQTLRRGFTSESKLPAEIQKHDIQWSTVLWTAAGIVCFGIAIVMFFLAVAMYGPQY